MDPRARSQIGLELRDVHVEGAIEAERGSQRRDDLRDQPVQVGVRRALDVQVPTADVVQCLSIDHIGDVRVFEQGVHAEHGVVGFDPRFLLDLHDDVKPRAAETKRQTPPKST